MSFTFIIPIKFFQIAESVADNCDAIFIVPADSCLPIYSLNGGPDKFCKQDTTQGSQIFYIIVIINI